MNTPPRASRHVSDVSIANGAKYNLRVNGDYFFIHAQSGVLTVSVNGDEFTPCQAGQLQQGTVGRDDFFEVVFYNTSGAAVTLTVIFGRGAMLVVGTVTLSAADIASITPAANALTKAVVRLTNAATATYSSKRSVSVTNIGTVDILVDGVTIPAGATLGWACERVQDTLPDVTVNTNTTPNGDALVTWTAD